ncbi:hypothetical protein AMS69_10245 [Haloarcula rubripromontorii]|uniref:Uncharacterized protein n=1 Tax=Haloarcula rubripromontorii TaxID=1705562 RepID=A0A0M9AIP8_9EURY|nr:hypothetical protein [Haloarcula rubripromontorii]KOX92829.1 hypothetical protein AMS69_10245 [Haloarcula rubripromontorii]
MVSPSYSWDETDYGYELDNKRISVDEMKMERWDTGERIETTAFNVQVRIGTPGYASPKDVLAYEDPKPAWEAANILTHFLEEWGKMGLSELQNTPSGDSLPTGLAEDDPIDLFEASLGYNDFKLKRALP